MTWQLVFNLANGLAFLMWLFLIVLPRREIVLTLVLYGGVGLLCLAYTAGVVGLSTGGFVGGSDDVDFTSIVGVQAIFASAGGATIGWMHYLAFDLFAGLWIARDADHKGFSRWMQAPVLLLTFVAGPAGLLTWLIVREGRARRAAPRRPRLRL